MSEWAYRRAIKDVKQLAKQKESESSDYMNELLSILERHGKEPVSTFEDLPAYQSLKKIIKGRCPENADDVLKNIESDAVIRGALEQLLDLRAFTDDEN